MQGMIMLLMDYMPSRRVCPPEKTNMHLVCLLGIINSFGELKGFDQTKEGSQRGDVSEKKKTVI
jgi:hypothetical protein